jgi:AcrR family transcriptional regulator
MNTSTNPLVIQSRTWIMNSLISLMKTKNFKDITISEIAKHADLSRRTFYRIFDSKEDVLESYFDFLADQFIAKISSYETFDCNAAFKRLPISIIKECLYVWLCNAP